MMTSIIAGTIAAVIAATFSYILLPVGRRLKLVDDPSAAERKVHKKPTVLIGGFAIAFAIILMLVGAQIYTPNLMPELSGLQWCALAIAAIIIFSVGYIDDRYTIPPSKQILGPIFAAAFVVIGGITISKITNPAGGEFSFASIPVISAILTFVWLMGMMYSTKLLDGLDGLSTGLSGIGAVMIFALTQTNQYYEPRVGFIAIIFAGACFGFLILNFHPARAFLGEGGSLFMGFCLGILAIMSGSKIATTLLVMGLPVVDVARVIIMRRLSGHPIARGDSQHLHHLLLANGLSHRGAVLLYYACGAIFGVTALFLQSRGKIIMLAALTMFGVVAAFYLQNRLRKRL